MARKAESMTTKFWGEIILLGFLLLEGVVKGFHVVHLEYMNKEAPAVAWKHRTGYHFQPQKNWMNDPNAPMYYNGYYHLFYQYNYKGTSWGNIVWGHSVSKDLVNWNHLKFALIPSKPFDIGGCWSGSATILPGNIPAILYTGLDKYNNQIQNIAFPNNLSDPFLQDWVKPDYNPIIFPEGVNATNFRDPTTAWMGHDGQWRIIVGTNRNKVGYAALYRSKDFKRWEKTKHVLHAVKDIGMWECPDFFPIAMEGEKAFDTSSTDATTTNIANMKYVFKVSLDKTRYEYYSIGTYDRATDRFVPDDHSMDNHHTGLRYDYGNFYASKSFYDAKVGRRILWGWSNESDTSDDDSIKGWAGIQVIPREVWLDRSGKQLVQRPVEEIKKLRLGKQPAVQLHNVHLNAGDIFQVKGFHTSEADVEVTFGLGDELLERAEEINNEHHYNYIIIDPQHLCQAKGAEVGGGGGPFGLYVLSSEDLRERTAVFFRIFKTSSNSHKLLMCHDINRSSFANSVWKPSFAGFVDVDIAKEKKISLRILMDNSVVESFGGGGKTCITSRVYPTVAIGGDSHLFAFNNGTTHVHITHLSAWQMKRPAVMN